MNMNYKEINTTKVLAMNDKKSLDDVEAEFLDAYQAFIEKNGFAGAKKIFNRIMDSAMTDEISLKVMEQKLRENSIPYELVGNRDRWEKKTTVRYNRSLFGKALKIIGNVL